MLLYRIAQAQHVCDLTGEGARMYGGRWNPPGIAIVYTSESVALALLEVLANVPHQLIGSCDFRKVVIQIPDSATMQTIAPAALPDGWSRFPHPAYLTKIGAEWVRQGDTLLLKVPSALTVGDGDNYLLNPLHPQASSVSVVRNERFTFDARYGR
jgi:RES domain-containing protein